MVRETLDRDAILKLYRDADVSIQVSSHEGLGLGFYESIAQGTPVVSLDVAPHNEAVVHQVTGWLLPATPRPLPDNDDGIVTAASFDVDQLASVLSELSRDEVEKCTIATNRALGARFDEIKFLMRLIEAIP